MSGIDSIKKNSIVKLLYEAPYRVRMYAQVCKRSRVNRMNLTGEDVLKIERYKNIHKGRRCFIVLTGPSLKPEDLALIKDEISFTVNSGYKAYGINGWEPWYYATADGGEVAQEMLQKALSNEYGYKGLFTDYDNPIADDRLTKLPSDSRLVFRMNSILNKLFPGLWTTGIMSSDISKRIYNGKTVLCMVLQIAAYMGFDSIYLMGADFNYSGASTHSSISQEKILDQSWDKRKTEDEMVFQMNDFAKDAKRKGIRVFNTTMNSKLECFEKVELKSLFV